MRKLALVHVLLTLDCNFRCSYCFVEHGPRTMSEDTLRRTIEFLVDPEVCEQSFGIDFFGGEPLLAAGLLLRGVDYARELATAHGMTVRAGVVSNMSLATPALLDELRAREIGLLCSYDGRRTHEGTRQAGTAGLIEANIRAAVERGIGCTVAMQLAPGHLEHLAADFADMAELGIRAVALNPIIHGVGRRYGEADWLEMDQQFMAIAGLLYQGKRWGNSFAWTQMDGQLQAIYRKALGQPDGHNSDWSCGACKGSLAVDPEGNIVPCHQMPTGWGFDEWVLGHVAEGQINAAPRARFLETRWEDCGECAVLRCAPCRSVNKAVTGSEYERAPDHCRYQRLLFTHAIRLHNRLVDVPGYRPGQ